MARKTGNGKWRFEVDGIIIEVMARGKNIAKAKAKVKAFGHPALAGKNFNSLRFNLVYKQKTVKQGKRFRLY